jgi:hypothetical protein
MKSFNEYVKPLDNLSEVKLNLPKVKLTEITVSPYYTQKGVANPYYDLDIPMDAITAAIGDGKITFKSVESPTGQQLLAVGRGKFQFQIERDGAETPYYVTTTKSVVQSHLGMGKRKDSTASSNVNELLSVYFLDKPEELKMDTVEWEMIVARKTGNTGVLLGDDTNLTYESMLELLDKDETAQRDIKIGQHNATAILSDLKGKSIKDVYWTPRGKPGGIDSKNPSDVMVLLDDGTFVGYSNKIAAGKDVTPKMNASVVAQYEKLGNAKQLLTVKGHIDTAWNDAVDSVNNPEVKKELLKVTSKVKREKYTEGGSVKSFYNLGVLFTKHNLSFYTQDFYWPFRNSCLAQMQSHLKKDVNLQYLLNTIGYYTYPDADSTACPYKLLIGSESGSRLKDVGADEDLKAVCLDTNKLHYKNIQMTYREGQQSFEVSFVYKPLKKKCVLPITMRTRRSGGWGGKALYMSSSGIRIT